MNKIYHIWSREDLYMGGIADFPYGTFRGIVYL